MRASWSPRGRRIIRQAQRGPQALRRRCVAGVRLTQGAAVGDRVVEPRQHDGAVLARKSGHQHLGPEAGDALGAQAGGADHLAPEQRVGAVERGQLGARLPGAEAAEVDPQLESRPAGLGKRLDPADRPGPQAHALEIGPAGRHVSFTHGTPSGKARPGGTAAGLSGGAGRIGYSLRHPLRYHPDSVACPTLSSDTRRSMWTGPGAANSTRTAPADRRSTSMATPRARRARWT